MSAKHISENSRLGSKSVILLLSAKMAIAIILISLIIILIVTVQLVPIQKINLAFLIDQIKALHFKPSTQTLDQPFLSGDRKDVLLRDHYLFFEDEYDFDSYGYP